MRSTVFGSSLGGPPRRRQGTGQTAGRHAAVTAPDGREASGPQDVTHRVGRPGTRQGTGQALGPGRPQPGTDGASVIATSRTSGSFVRPAAPTGSRAQPAHAPTVDRRAGGGAPSAGVPRSYTAEWNWFSGSGAPGFTVRNGSSAGCEAYTWSASSWAVPSPSRPDHSHWAYRAKPSMIQTSFRPARELVDPSVPLERSLGAVRGAVPTGEAVYAGLRP
ncbi:hypothetical protein GCM10010398_70030 [Streptomyces fimbriatus]